MVERIDRVQPERLSHKQLDALSDDARDDYELRRREWHANLGPIKTPQLIELHDHLWYIVDGNAQDGDKAKGAVRSMRSQAWERRPRCWLLPATITDVKFEPWALSPIRVLSAGRYAGSG